MGQSARVCEAFETCLNQAPFLLKVVLVFQEIHFDLSDVRSVLLTLVICGLSNGLAVVFIFSSVRQVLQ